MFTAERSKYKSWSNLKKQMNDLLCDSLKDKIYYTPGNNGYENEVKEIRKRKGKKR